MVLGSPLVIRHGNLELQHLGGLGFDPPDFVIEAVRQAAGDPDAQRQLYAAGQGLANKIAKLPGGAAGPAGKPSAWSRLVSPLLTPIGAGAQDTLTPKLAGIAIGLVAAGAALGYFAGRRGRR